MFSFNKEKGEDDNPLSPMLDSQRIDLVALDNKRDRVVLSMTEIRPWGKRGENLFDLEAKINSYLNYVESGSLVEDFPATAGKKVTFRLQSTTPLGDREEAFVILVREKYLDPRSIDWETSVI